MKIFAFLALSTTAFSMNDGVVPVAFSKDRYEETRTESPFVLATKVEAPEVKPPEIKFTQNLYITGLGRADGKEYVTIVRVGEESNPIRLWGNEEGEDGITVQQVIWSDTFGKSRVKLKKGSENGEIGFNENAIRSATAGVAPAQQPPGVRPPTFPNGGTPNFPQAPQGFNRPVGTPTNIPQTGRPTGATPQTGASIPRPPGSFTAPPTGNGGAQTQGRQRVRVINSGPGR